ncbi:TetR family transcriptional regulator [Kribbella orskensis]|uniref:TetR family transcriptional regulator n=1 Tax=Kribbella orskensis TaxID=2512216 RepID=A0ABY2BL80_9ACTN|nr:TetR family transcriptional regulator [Kribbella sp. VKM Ac-2500]TCO21777.1 TetR family transcriptional regulator [Kribbella orskensis]
MPRTPEDLRSTSDSSDPVSVSDTSDPVGGRRLRADARAKREAVLAAAVEVFAERGVDIALDEVARRAKVGIATLYRHFPTREALITGAYVREIGALCDGVEELLGEMAPDEALISWMQRFIGYVSGRPGMAQAVKAVVVATDSTAVQLSHVKVYAALEAMLEAGIEAGLFRSDITVDDVAGALSGFSLSVGSPGSKERADRLVRLLVDGLRYGAPTT